MNVFKRIHGNKKEGIWWAGEARAFQSPEERCHVTLPLRNRNRWESLGTTEDNTNKRPSQNPAIWKKLETQKIDLNAIFNQMKPYIDTEITDQVREQLLEAINNLPTIEYIEQNREQVLFFNSEQDFINFKNETGTTDRDYETLPFNATPTDYEEVRNKVNTNETNIRDLNNQLMTVQNSSDRNSQRIEQWTNTIDNAVTTNGTQTISGAKTFTNEVVISKNPTPLVLKANNNDKTYMLIKSSDNNTNFSLGANATDTSLEVNRGHLILKTLQANKNVTFENVAEVKLNRSKIQLGTEINAGYGGGVVKFIPEGNSTKTLQFFNNNANDTRRFKLAVPEPVDNNNPATKNYVDTLKTGNNVWSGTNYFNDLIANDSRYGLKTEVITTIASDKTLTLKANGGRELGNLALANPVNDNHSATKQYVDNAISTLETNVDYNKVLIDNINDNLNSSLRYRQITYKLTGNTSSLGGGAAPQEFTIDSKTRGLILPGNITINNVLNISLQLPLESSLTAVKYYSLSYCAGAANRGGENVVVVVKDNGYPGGGGTIQTNQINIIITLIQR